MSGPRYLITGARGFLGGHLAHYLRQHVPGCRVDGIDRGDDLKSALTGDIAAVFAMTGVTRGDDLVEANLAPLRELRDGLAALGAKPVVVVPGSAAEYGDLPGGRGAFRESDTCHPINDYGRAKLAVTTEVLRWDLPVRVGRIFNICGPDVPETLAAGRFASRIRALRAAGGGTLETQSLSDVRDFVDVDDVCAALLTLAGRDVAAGVYNVATGEGHDVGALLRELLKAAALEGVEIQEKKTNDARRITASVGDCSKLRALGWKPRHSLADSARRALA